MRSHGSKGTTVRMRQRKQPIRKIRRSRHRGMIRHWPLYVMLLPSLFSLLVFGYGPYFGLTVAFQDFSIIRGYFGSQWAGFKHFIAAFETPFFFDALWNTLIIKGFQTLVGFPSAIILALMLNEVRLRWFKRTVQTVTMLPYFISWIVIAAMFRNLMTTDGLVNQILQLGFGFKEPIKFLSDPLIFRWFIILQDTWKFAGFFAVIYIAAISAISPILYEAATVDGATRWQQAWHITLPGIRRTMLTLFILLVGYLMIGSFEQIFCQYSVVVYPTADILETYTYRLGLQQGKYSFATAVGLFQASVAVLLVVSANFVVRRWGEEGLF